MDSDRNFVRKFFGKIFKTTLHEDIKNHVDPKTVRLKIKKRPNIDYKDRYLKTPLYYACENDEIEWACMLLYYGADPCILCTCKNLLPIFATKCPILQEILLPYYICHESKISLVTLGAGLQAPPDIFSKFMENVKDIDVDIYDVDLFVNKQVVKTNMSNFQLFVEKFTEVAWELCTRYMLLDKVQAELAEVAYIFEKLLSSENLNKLQFYKPDLDFHPVHFADLFTYPSYENTCSYSELVPLKQSTSTSVIAHYVAKFSYCDILNQDQITSNVLLMISYGLEVTMYDLATIFAIYGQCELFEILLRVDLADRCLQPQQLLPIICKYRLRRGSVHKISFLFYLYCFPALCVDNFCRYRYVGIIGDPAVFHIYSESELKRLGFPIMSEKNIEKIKNLPDVPKLIELSRNVVRDFLVRKYNIQTSKQLMFVLDSLPIDRMTKRIIALLEKLY